MGEFCAWYARLFWSSLMKAYSLHKSILGWVVLVIGAAVMFLPFWQAFVTNAEAMEGWMKATGPFLVFFALLVLGPLWFAFEESQKKDASIKALEGSIKTLESDAVNLKSANERIATSDPRKNAIRDHLGHLIECYRQVHWLFVNARRNAVGELFRFDAECAEYLKANMPSYVRFFSTYEQEWYYPVEKLDDDESISSEETQKYMKIVDNRIEKLGELLKIVG